MKALLLIAVLAAACKPSKPVAEAPAAPAGQPEPAPAMDKNTAEKYVSGLQADVKRAEAARDKANEAVKKEQESGKAPE
jgi:hypothetical protein